MGSCHGTRGSALMCGVPTHFAVVAEAVHGAVPLHVACPLTSVAQIGHLTVPPNVVQLGALADHLIKDTQHLIKEAQAIMIDWPLTSVAQIGHHVFFSKKNSTTTPSFLCGTFHLVVVFWHRDLRELQTKQNRIKLKSTKFY